MTFKEKLLEWLIRPERFYIRRYMHLLRKEEKYLLVRHNPVLGYWYRARKNRLGTRLGFLIHAGCLGEDIWIEHCGIVMIHPRARLGKGCKIHGSCCIGSNGGYPDDPPILGDYVDIGLNAQVVGPVRIADHVKIGSGAVVVKDVLVPGATVVGVPARIIEPKQKA